jgi:hypothetical protein
VSWGERPGLAARYLILFGGEIALTPYGSYFFGLSPRALSPAGTTPLTAASRGEKSNGSPFPGQGWGSQYGVGSIPSSGSPLDPLLYGNRTRASQ